MAGVVFRGLEGGWQEWKGVNVHLTLQHRRQDVAKVGVDTLAGGVVTVKMF